MLSLLSGIILKNRFYSLSNFKVNELINFRAGKSFVALNFMLRLASYSVFEVFLLVVEGSE